MFSICKRRFMESDFLLAKSFIRLNRMLASKEFIVMGIETSCDDTGVGVVSNKGVIMDRTGGVVPSVARKLHEENIDLVTLEAIEKANINIQDVQAISVTRGPGLALSLSVGIKHAKDLSEKFGKPLIPVHHMEAHALTVRLLHPISFPFLVLLVSGGHCILLVCEAFGKFFRLGQTLDDSPGEALDKVSRMLRLHLHPLGVGLPGGAAIENISKYGDPLYYQLPHIMSSRLDCHFSFAGIKTAVQHIVYELEQEMTTDPSIPIPGCEHVAAAFQQAVFRHIITRTERAILYCQKQWPMLSNLVVSGGVASNMYLRIHLESLTSKHGYNLYCPPPYLCTDNGVMIAWAGVEHITAGLPYHNSSNMDYLPRWPLGEDISSHVAETKIKIKKMK